MTVQLFEGCWGVTRGAPQEVVKIGKGYEGRWQAAWMVSGCYIGQWLDDGSADMFETSAKNVRFDIIAVFATEAEADAYLAGQSAEANCPDCGLPKPSSNPYCFCKPDPRLSVPEGPMPPAPKPMTWPQRASGPFTAESDWLTLISDAMTEANKAMVKFPQPNYVISKFAEEAGEVVKAAIHCAEGRETPQNLRGEIKQAIAMLYRLWNEGDQVHGLQPVAALLLAAADKVEGRG